MNQRRSKLQVVADVLRVIEKEQGRRVKPTHILYKANLSHKLLKEHLNFLLQKGYVQVELDGNHTYYRITPTGQKFLVELRRVEKLSQAFGLPA